MLLRGVSTLLLMCCWASRSTETSETAALWVWTPSDSTAEEEGRMLFYFRKVDVFDTTLISAGPKIFLSCRWDSLLLKFISLSLALPPVCVMWLCCFTPRWYLSGRLWADPETWRWVSTADVEQIKSNEDKSWWIWRLADFSLSITVGTNLTLVQKKYQIWQTFSTFWKKPGYWTLPPSLSRLAKANKLVVFTETERQLSPHDSRD